MREVLRSKASEEDVREIWLRIAKDDPAAADAFVRNLDDRLDTLCRYPFMGKSRQSLAPVLMSFSFGQVAVFYTQDEEGLKVIRILQGAGM